MVFTKYGKFEVGIVDENDVIMEEFTAKDKKNVTYVCGEEGSSFKIRLKSLSNDFRTYGAILYIDGIKIPGIKTFRRYGNYFGFKLGGGKYRRFEFSAPKFEDEENDEEFGGDSNIGKIKIKFFNTKKILANNRREKRAVRYFPHKPKGLPSNKKMFNKSLQIKEGMEYDNGHSVRSLHNKESYTKYYEHCIDYNDQLDEITLYYSDYYAMIISGMLSSFNPLHLKYMPFKKEKNYDLCEKALVGIYKTNADDNMNAIEFEKMEKDYEKYARHPLSHYYNENDNITNSRQLIENRFSKNFEFTIDGKMIKYKDEVDLRNEEYIKTSLILSKKEKDLLEKRKDEKAYSKVINEDSTKENNNTNDKMMDIDNEIVDLTVN